MIPHGIVLEPGPVIFKIYNRCWFFAGPQKSYTSPNSSFQTASLLL
jgi:hypothetical protein